MNNNVSSRQYNTLSTECLTLIGDIRAAQLKLESTLDLAQDLGVNVKQGDTETNIAYLARIASDATEKKHDALKSEALEDIKEETTGNVRSNRQRTFLGRSMGKLASILG